jgi:hypothetical protein
MGPILGELHACLPRGSARRYSVQSETTGAWSGARGMSRPWGGVFDRGAGNDAPPVEEQVILCR